MKMEENNKMQERESHPAFWQVFIGMVLSVSLMLLMGCQGPPWHVVDSYERVKEDLAADQPNIIYPDISRYEQTGTLIYHVNLYQQDRRIANGYEIYSPDDKLENADSDSVFLSIGVAGFSIEQYYDDLNPCPPLEGTIKYRSLDMEYVEAESTEYLNGEQTSKPYPQGSRLGDFRCTFEWDGYRYDVLARVLLVPDDLEKTSFEEEMEKAHRELFLIIDDILNQGEVPQ
jgi:hypothetical protein